MQELYPSYVKTVAADGDLDAASQRKLIQDVPYKLTIDRKLLEHILSDNPNPNEIIALQPSFLSTYVMGAAEYTDMPNVLGRGTASGDIYTLTQGIDSLSKFDHRIAVMRTDGTTLTFIDITDLFYVPKLEAQFQAAGRFYLPCEMKGSDTSQLTWDISPA